MDRTNWVHVLYRQARGGPWTGNRRCTRFGCLLCCDERPAHNRATNRTPPAESLIDLGCQCSLLPKRTLGLNLRIRDVAHCNPARGLVPHLTGDEPKYGISHFRHITQPLKVIMIIRGIEAKEISRHDG